MFSFKYRTLNFCAAFILLLVLVSTGVTSAFAASPSPDTHSATMLATAVIRPGILSVAVGAPSTPVSTALNGSVREIRYTLPVTVTDATGSGDGWTLSMQNSARTAPQSVLAMFVTGAIVSCTQASSCKNPVSTISGPIAIPADTMAAPVQVFNAAPHTGIGASTVTLMISVFVPANAPVSVYGNALAINLSSN